MAAGYSKGRATGYTDYYKNKTNTPDDDDEMSETIIPRRSTQPVKADKPMDMVARRKAALKRRLAKKAGK